MGKTPDEIKKGLECCSNTTVESCGECPYHTKEDYSAVCIVHLTKDAKALLAQVERERDAAVHDMENYAGYGAICKHFDNDCPHIVEGCPLWPSDCESYEWRGVCEENTKEENR